MWLLCSYIMGVGSVYYMIGSGLASSPDHTQLFKIAPLKSWGTRLVADHVHTPCNSKLIYYVMSRLESTRYTVIATGA